MPDVDAGYSELEQAFKSHSLEAGKETSPSHFLLLFYAVECGLKSEILQRRNVNRVGQMGKELEIHDLYSLVEMLKFPVSLMDPSKSSFRLRRSKSSRPIEHAHQAWRYGVAMNKEARVWPPSRREPVPQFPEIQHPFRGERDIQWPGCCAEHHLPGDRRRGVMD